ncbi:MAG: ShlB/FhaC/HecB family hemolysin secretion/activation protein [Burkholderiales bacterium]
MREQQKPALDIPTRTAPAIQLEAPARPVLKPSASARFLLKGFRVTGNTVFAESELLVLVRDYAGKDASFADLDQATARISRYYRERGYLVARAYLPAQDIKDGMVEIAVIEGRFGKVNIDNRSRVRDGVARGYTNAFPGMAVTEAGIERKMLLLNDLPGVGDGRATLSPGANVGESDLSVELTPGSLATGSVEFDNFGNRFTGANRLTGKLNVLSPFGLGDLFSAQVTKGFNGLDYGRLAYQLPVGGDGFKLGGAYSRTQYRLGKLFSALDASGESDTVSLNVSYPFIRTRNINLYGQAAYELRDFQDRVASTATVTDKSTRAATLSFSGDARDSLLGGGISVFSVGYGSGRANIETPSARAIDDVTARTHGHFGKWNVNFLRLQRLGERLSAYVSFAGQKAGTNLDSSEKFSLGGANGVRAYPSGEASGDSGYLATVELRYTFSMAAIPGVVQPFVFIDTGGVTINENSFVAGANSRHLSAGGFGLSWVKAGDFQVKLTLASRLGSEPSLSSDSDRHTRGWVQAIKYF